MRAKIALLLSASLLTGAIAATAQPLPCASVAPEVRERVREAGACRDATPEEVAPTGASPAPSTAVTMKLSDGTVVRIPSEISSTIHDGRKRAATNGTAKPKSVPRASAQSKPSASGGPVLADGSLARAADTTSVTAPANAAAAPSAPASAADPAPATTTAPATASEPTVPPAPRARFPIAFSANAALILGAGVFLGLLLGALLMRQWLLRRKPLADEGAAPPTLYQHQQPVDTGTGGVETEAAPEIRFAARLYAGETTIALVPHPDGEEVAIEQSSDQHA